MKKAILIYFFPFAFLVIIALPSINNIFPLWDFPRTEENRVFHDSVPFNINKLDDFPNDFENYYNDNFSFRSPFHDFYHTIKFHFYKVSPDEENVVMGKDNWYFLGGDEKDIFVGRKNFSSKELNQFSTEWKKRFSYFNSKKIKAYWLICPTKYSVYSDKLPFNVVSNGKSSRTELLTKHLHEQLPNFILNPVDILKKNRNKHKLYYQLDNHWNSRAGSIVTEFLLLKMKDDFPQLNTNFLSNYLWKDTIKRDGIHKAALGIDHLFEYNEVTIQKELFTQVDSLYGFKSPDGFPYPWAYEFRFKNNKTKPCRILIIRDSFGDVLLPFLKEAFSESVFIFDAWRYQLNEDIIEKVKPDIVLYVTLETHLANLISN